MATSSAPDPSATASGDGAGGFGGAQFAAIMMQFQAMKSGMDEQCSKFHNTLKQVDEKVDRNHRSLQEQIDQLE